MSEWIVLSVIWVISEVFVAMIFAVIAQLFYKKIGFDFKAISKGIIERGFLFIALVNGYTQALTFFSALKVATRLKHNEEPANIDHFNDYYLLGNLISVAVAIGYVYLYSHFTEIHFLEQLTK